MNTRAVAAKILAQLLNGQGSLSTLLPVYSKEVNSLDQALLKELCFGVCRFYFRLNTYLEKLLSKPLRAKDADIKALLLLGLYQYIFTRIPDHAAIGETVEAARELKKNWATELINAVLRNYQRSQSELHSQLQENKDFVTNHPAWFIGMINKAWPDQVTSIIAANDQHPPFTLRVNTKRITRENYLQQLNDLEIKATATKYSPYGITLEQPCDPKNLPGFTEGLVSVQDEAAQLCVDLLQLSPKLTVLDACCAPGGKTGHMLEQFPDLQVTALDVEARRLEKVKDNLTRLQVEANIVCGDASKPDSWWNGQLYDRILVDAPCSATGIIRRHPDIKILRQADEIQLLAQTQSHLLMSLWPLLKPGGILLYATCSILPKENNQVIVAFLQQHSEAQANLLIADWGITQTHGLQLLPQLNGHDGFYYSLLKKIL
jgi:16S rRNA (cytosine967-C5)-methyltransferase